MVVVGDPQQLPPTDFFARQDDAEESADPAEQDLESVLNECRSRGMAELELNWHYRSRHESLITFSNHTYYGGRLVTFPSPVAQDQAVSFRYVSDGVYGRSGSRTNPIEAQRVVAETVRRLEAMIAGGSPAESIGIVTFNAQQQSLIETLLDRERESNPALEPFFSETAAEPVLIKNLEGVQGEERDVMLFSLTFGPDAAGKVAMNFGPLNSSGGERRLNVAVTRARNELVVFGSLRAEQLDLARTNALGIRHLKQFLAYAERGAKAFAGIEESGIGDYDSPFEAAVADRLRAQGWEVRAQIGVSGFRIDLGVVDPDAAGAYLAGVECDGATYHRGATARDRDRLRQSVLEGLGWAILRIWSTDWWTNADREAARLHSSLRALLDLRRRQREAETARPREAIASGAEPAPAPAEQPEVAVADPALFYDASYRPRLAALLATTLAELGPLREDVLAQIVARAHGFERTGGDIRARVLAALPPGSVLSHEAVGTFVWPPACGPAGLSVFRPPAPGGSRDPTEIPMEELLVLARKALSGAPDEEAALLAMRDACGLQRLRDRSRQRCAEALGRARQRAAVSGRAVQ